MDLFQNSPAAVQHYLLLDQNDVRPEGPGHCKELRKVPSLSYDAKVILHAEELLEPQAEDAFAIRDQDFRPGLIVGAYSKVHS